MKKMVVFVFLMVVLSSVGFAQENPAPNVTHKYQPFDMLLGFGGNAGFNMKGDVISLKKGYFIATAAVGVNYDVYFLYWLSASTGLYANEVMSLNLSKDEPNQTFTDMLRTPLCLTIPFQVHVNVPRLEWLYLGAGLNFNIPLFSVIPSKAGIPDTKGDPFISLPIDIGIDVTPGGKYKRFVFRVTPHFFEEEGTLITFGIMYQSNIKIYSKKS